MKKILSLLIATSLFTNPITNFKVNATGVPFGPEKAFVLVVVAQNDTLWEIAQDNFPNHDPRKVIEWIKEDNGLSTSLIYPGQELKLRKL